MKKHLFKFALTLLVCMLSNAALADENYLVHEDFSTFPSGSSASYNNEYNGWKLNFCRIVSNELYVALKIEDNSGYARTPTLDNEYEGDVHLSFKYANGQWQNPNEHEICPAKSDKFGQKTDNLCHSIQ